MWSSGGTQSSASWRWRNSNSSEWQALEFHHRIPPYHWLLIYTSRGAMNTLTIRLISTHLWPVAKFWTFSEYQWLNLDESDRALWKTITTRLDSAQLIWPVELSWVESRRENVHSARSDWVQLVDLSRIRRYEQECEHFFCSKCLPQAYMRMSQPLSKTRDTFIVLW